MKRQPFVLAAMAAAIALLTAMPQAAQPRAKLEFPAYPHAQATPIPFDWRNPQREQFGRLTFRGGLEFSYDENRRFGGLSGIAVTEDGSRFIAVTDAGDYVGGTLDYDNGRLSGVGDISLSRLRDMTGTRLKYRSDRDAESIAPADGLFLNRRVLVSFEHNHRIAAYDVGESGEFSASKILPLPPAVAGMSSNQGLEAIGLFPEGTPLAGRIIAISERKLDDNRNHTGWLIKGNTAREFRLARSDAFEITDLAILPDGNVIILERRYAPIFGLAMRLRLIAWQQFTSGEIVDGEVLLTADNRYSVGNMEGLAIHRDGDGGIVLTIVSDNNFNRDWRTLMLQFRLD